MKRNLFVAIATIIVSQCFGQLDVSDSGDISRERWRDSVLRVDKSPVPTGFLEEYGMPMLPMKTSNGSLSDSNKIDMNLWRTTKNLHLAVKN